MAHYLRRPILSASLLFSRRLQNRYFSAGSSQWAVKSQLAPQQHKLPPERSVTVTAKELGKFPSDLGLIKGTFIFPTGPNRPRLYKQPIALLRLQWTRVRRKIRDFTALMLYKFNNTPRLKLRLRQTAPTALGLHRQMYSAFASGDISTLKKVCAEGLLESFRARIHGRPKGERWEWELLRYTKRARVVSHRGAGFPIGGAGLRQAVVRIASRQKLTRYRPDGRLVEGSGKVKDVLEYVVVQRRLDGGKEGEWLVWGTTGETTLEMVEEERRAALD